MAKFLRADATLSSAYLEFYFVGDEPTISLSFRFRIPSGDIPTWMDEGNSAYVGMVSVEGAIAGTVVQVNMGSQAGLAGFYWEGVYGISAESGNTPDPNSSFGDIWHDGKLNYTNGSLSEFIVDGVTVWSSSSPTSNDDANHFSIGALPGLTPDWPGVIFYDEIKLGTTDGGMELLYEDFESGTFALWSNAIGDVSVVDSFDPPAPPANDDWANAINLPTASGSVDGTTVLATADHPSASVFGFSGPQVWYKFTPEFDGLLTLDLNGKSMSDPDAIVDTVLSVYSGADFASLVLESADDDGGDAPRSKITDLPVVSGTTYYIEIAAISDPDTGTFTLTWDGPVPVGFSGPGSGLLYPTQWKIGVYTRDATPVDSTSYDGSVTDEFLKHVTQAVWTIPLNGIDTLSFTLYLDDPAAALISRKQTWIRAWRVVNDTEHSKFRDPPPETPDFCGVVTGITKNAEANTMDVTVMSALWLVQTHFHLLNHRLVNDPSDVPVYRDGSNETDLPWDHSALMYHLIDLINGAFKASGGDTGIRRPPTADFSGSGYMVGLDLYWPQTIQVGPLYIQKGEYTWPILYDDLLARASSPDIVPEYINTEGSIDTMYFRTAVQRGEDKTGTFSFDYRTGRNNLEDATEQDQVPPTEYANFVWISGDGGPNTYVSEQSDAGDITANGVYMKHENIPGAKKSDIQQIADDKLVVAVHADAPIYSVGVSPAAEDPVYYDVDYTVGDLVGLNVDRGAFQVVDGKQRIYQVTLRWSDNSIETAEVMISADFKRKFPDA